MDYHQSPHLFTGQHPSLANHSPAITHHQLPIVAAKHLLPLITPPPIIFTITSGHPALLVVCSLSHTTNSHLGHGSFLSLIAYCHKTPFAVNYPTILTGHLRTFTDYQRSVYYPPLSATTCHRPTISHQFPHYPNHPPLSSITQLLWLATY